jgi:hypothetical protein
MIRLCWIHKVRQPRADRVGQEDADAWAMGLEEPADAGDRPARPDATDEGPDSAAALLEDLRAGRRLVDARVGWVGELLGQKPAPLFRLAPRDILEIVARGRGALGTMTTSAPTVARAARLSADIFSGITQTRW